MQKFILGYVVDTDSLEQFEDMKTADFETEDWCVVPAETLEEAKTKYEDYFEMWEQNPDTYLEKVNLLIDLNKQHETVI